MSIAIKIENVSKQYRLGKVGTGTLSHDLNRWWHLVRGKEDPYLKIGETNDRTTKGESDYVWALRDINFEIEQGTAVGIIGRNGAGKSTLLKILSRTTAPTTGNIRLRGRVASLLEVGTGFHPELSGRENIYLNGAILGMTRHEISRKFDEIVDFSGVERYIDTPVKRYSSGMYVRLAFAVAAHLESEILIVDEVLAVGDSEFQKKCLGKMGEVSKGGGRTVLFVSHNIAAIKSLCNISLLLENGTLSFKGNTDDSIDLYLKKPNLTSVNLCDLTDREGNGKVMVSEVTFKNNKNEIIDQILCSDFLKIDVKLKEIEKMDYTKMIVVCYFSDPYQNQILSWVSDEMPQKFVQNTEPSFSLVIPQLNLRPGQYDLNIGISFNTTATSDYTDIITSVAQLSVIESDFYGAGRKIRAGHRAILGAEFIICLQ